MNYRYYIYKQVNLTAGFDKYDLTDYNLLQEIQQNSQWGLKIERDKEFYTVIRRKFNGEITVKGDDFSALIALEGDTKQYAIVIHRECAGVWSEFWKGYFSYFDYKVDLDRCYLSFEPEVWDEYSPVYDQMNMERNVLGADTDHSVYLQSLIYAYEEISENIALLASIPAASWVESTSYPAGNLYYLYSRDGYFEYFDSSGLPVFGMTDKFRRDYAITLDGVNPPDADPLWVLDPLLSGPGEYNLALGQYKWVKPFLSLTAGTATYTHTVNGLNEFYQLDVASVEQIILEGCKFLNKVLEYFAGIFNLTYASDFFYDDPCPLGGRKLSLTMIQQISNLRATDEQATKGMMKLKDLLTWIRDTFNAYWYIDSNGDFRIEHRKYFEWGLSYTVVAGVEMDISTLYPENILKLRRYEWVKPALTRFEKLEFPYSNTSDWVDANIEYTQYSISGNETVTKTVEWGTDINNMYAGRAELPKKGWVLYDVYLTGIMVMYYKVVNTTGAISGTPLQNARFSSANVQREFWTWGRLLPTGNVNGVATTFDSIERLKKQVEFSIPQCCQDIDYNGIFRTPLGDGLLDGAEYEAKTGNLKMNLIYE